MNFSPSHPIPSLTSRHGNPPFPRAQSVQINKARLQVLQARDQVLEAVLEETKKQLRDISSSSDASRYESLLEQLVLQVRPHVMPSSELVTLMILLLSVSSSLWMSGS